MKVTSGAKLSKEELEGIQKIQERSESLIKELGQISLAKINLKERKSKADKFLEDLKRDEYLFAKELEAKYGKGSINMLTGEFVPLP